jgi:GH15 family glucan-1,4-alpha-glucosidase
MTASPYPPIDHYGFIADCHSAALVGRSGSIDWCCMPRLDSNSCFGRILDWERAGYCRIAPSAQHEARRQYRQDSLVLDTMFKTGSGRVRLTDCFTMRAGGAHNPHHQLLRVVEGLSGSIELTVTIAARFDMGAVKPWLRRYRKKAHIALGGCHGLLVSGDMPLEIAQRHDLAAAFTVRAGERRRLSIIHRPPETLDDDAVEIPGPEELDRRLEETVDWWDTWGNQGRCQGPFAEHLKRSAIVLKGLSNAPTGAISAAATTSLPEAPGGSRNWDYRFSWIRDSAFTVRALSQLNFVKEADGFRRFIERSAAGSARQLQVLYGIGGERRLHEYEIGELEGYRGAKPVRIGNAAERQLQLDAYGEIVDLAWRWYRRGHCPDDDYWAFLVDLVDKVCRDWQSPDRGIWEFRGRPRHFVHSKVMCWAALDDGIRLAEGLGRDAPLGKWTAMREKIRQEVETKGYDAARGLFVQAFGSTQMDAALLLLPQVGFLPYDDPRMVRTTDAVWEALNEDGLLRRYTDGNDGMSGREGVFLACSFWLAECLARQKRMDRARQVFLRALGTGNDLGLFSEEFDTKAGEMLGNFPQGLTHLSLISAALALNDGGDAAEKSN